MNYTMQYNEERDSWNIYDTETGEWIAEGTYEQMEAMMEAHVACVLDQEDERFAPDDYYGDEDEESEYDGVCGFSLLSDREYREEEKYNIIEAIAESEGITFAEACERWEKGTVNDEVSQPITDNFDPRYDTDEWQ